MIINITIALISVFIASCSQILLKKSADESHNKAIASIFNKKVMLAYTFFSLSLCINIVVMRRGLDLKWFPIIESLGLIFVSLLSMVLLKESIKKEWLGILVIFIGAILFNF